MKRIQVVAKIKEIIETNPRLIDGITTKDLKEKLEQLYQFNVSVKMLNSVLIEITDGNKKDIENEEGGYVTKYGRFVRGDEHGNGDSKLKGLHKYWWFFT